jgi:hypothetical protein
VPIKPGEQSRKYDRGRYAERRAAGLCTHHGCPERAEAGFACCPEHREYKRRENLRRWRKKRSQTREVTA